MSLERPDVKFRLDPEYHSALKTICDADGVTLAEFVERHMVAAIRERVHAATLIAQRTAGLGISGNGRDPSASADKGGQR